MLQTFFQGIVLTSILGSIPALLLVLVKCVHWFNPMVYCVGNQVSQECEISCDLAVIEKMSKAERMSYVDTILALFAEQKHKDYALTMGMAGSKTLLKKRFYMMKNRITVSKKMQRWSVSVEELLASAEMEIITEAFGETLQLYRQDVYAVNQLTEKKMGAYK